jgi:pantoate--beta-alanine ligase
MAPMRRARLRRVRTATQVRRAVAAWRRAGDRVAFVPTMGAIHAGHLSLVARARTSADRVVVSIFVNPLQFAPGEDYGSYPRPRRQDRALLAAARADLLWEPSAAEMYPPDAVTRVRVTGIGDRLEGASRPGHFEGVATVVLKLLNVVMPDEIWLGQKDAQQARLIEQMCRDLFLGVRVRRGATHREPDGLARSSRNAYLTRKERAEAAAISRGLRAALAALEHGERGAAALKREVRRELKAHPLLREDYVAVVDAGSLEPVARVSRRVLIAVAARIGRARLIDNLEWQPRARRGGAS